MTTYKPFGTEKFLGTALRSYDGIENRRSWEAMRFPIHPAHDSARDSVNLDRGFTVIHLV